MSDKWRSIQSSWSPIRNLYRIKTKTTTPAFDSVKQTAYSTRSCLRVKLLFQWKILLWTKGTFLSLWKLADGWFHNCDPSSQSVLFPSSAAVISTYCWWQANHFYPGLIHAQRAFRICTSDVVRWARCTGALILEHICTWCNNSCVLHKHLFGVLGKYSETGERIRNTDMKADVSPNLESDVGDPWLHIVTDLDKHVFRWDWEERRRCSEKEKDELKC